MAIDDLPDVVLLHILKCLSVADLLAVSKINKRLCSLCFEGYVVRYCRVRNKKKNRKVLTPVFLYYRPCPILYPCYQLVNYQLFMTNISNKSYPNRGRQSVGLSVPYPFTYMIW